MVEPGPVKPNFLRLNSWWQGLELLVVFIHTKAIYGQIIQRFWLALTINLLLLQQIELYCDIKQLHELAMDPIQTFIWLSLDRMFTHSLTLVLTLRTVFNYLILVSGVFYHNLLVLLHILALARGLHLLLIGGSFHSPISVYLCLIINWLFYPNVSH